MSCIWILFDRAARPVQGPHPRRFASATPPPRSCRGENNTSSTKWNQRFVLLIKRRTSGQQSLCFLVSSSFAQNCSFEKMGENAQIQKAIGYVRSKTDSNDHCISSFTISVYSSPSDDKTRSAWNSSIHLFQYVGFHLSLFSEIALFPQM